MTQKRRPRKNYYRKSKENCDKPTRQKKNAMPLWSDVLAKSKMSEEELLATIDVVATRLAKRFAFAYFDADDLKQEIFIMACTAIVRSYDGERPIQNFLWTHCRNRSINFKRDHYYRGGEVSEEQEKINSIRRNLLNTIDIDMIECVDDDTDYVFNKLYKDELLAMIDAKMPIEIREYWLKWKSGVPISSNRREQVEEILLEIIDGTEEHDIQTRSIQRKRGQVSS